MILAIAALAIAGLAAAVYVRGRRIRRRGVAIQTIEARLRTVFRVSGDPAIGRAWFRAMAVRYLVEDLGTSPAEAEAEVARIDWERIAVTRELVRG